MGHAKARIFGIVTIDRVLNLGQGLHEHHIEHQRAIAKLSDHADCVLWNIKKFIPCRTAVDLPSCASLSWSAIAHLKLSAEVVQLFSTFALGEVPLSLRERPRAFRVDLSLATWFAGEKPPFIVTNRTYLNAAGLKPPVETHQGVLPSVLKDMYKHGDIDPPDMPSTCSTEAVQNVVQRPGNVSQDMFKPEVILMAWKIKASLKSGKTALSDIIEMSLKMACPKDILPRALHDLRSGVTRIPGREVLRKADFRVNLIDLLYQRQLLNNHVFARFWQGDSSPQGGHNFFVLVEDRLKWSSRQTVEERLAVNWDSQFERRHLTTTTLGYGMGSLLGKASNTQHATALEAGTWVKFTAIRYSVKTWSSDQGVDCQIVDSPCLIDEDFKNLTNLLQDMTESKITMNSEAAAEAYFLPFCLYYPDHLHIIYNAFEESVCAIPTWADRSVVDVTSTATS